VSIALTTITPHTPPPAASTRLPLLLSLGSRAGEVLAKEMGETETALEPLRRELAEVEEAAKAAQHRIAQSKASIAANDSRMQQLVRLVVFK